MTYYDFEVTIEKVAAVYHTRAEAEAMGEASGQLALEPRNFDSALQRLAAGQIDGNFLVEVGKLLFDGLFAGEVRDLYRVARQHALKEDKGLRIRLRIEDPEIAALPWELLFDKSNDAFLSTSAQTPLIRCVGPLDRTDEFKADLPVKVLVVISASEGLDVAQEKTAITNSLAESGGGITTDFLEGAVSRSMISAALSKDGYNILHFIGAGDAQDGTPRLVIAAADGKRDLIGARSLAGFCAEAPTVRLVIFSPFKGAGEPATRPFLELASQLVGKGVAASLGFRYPVSPEAAATFFAELYRRLSKAPERGRLDTALSHARNRSQIEFPEARDFASPVAFTRVPSCVVFSLETGQGGEAAPFEADFRTWRTLIAAAVLASLIVFAAYWVGLLDVADGWVDQRFTGFMDDHVNLTFAHDKIALIIADGDSKQNGTLGEFGEDWRPRHAEMISGLVKAGASVVTLDISFERSNRSGADLWKAIDQSRGTATKVIMGVSDFQADLQNPKPDTMEALLDLPPENWAITEVGLGPQSSHYLSRLLLALHPNKQPDERAHFRNLSVVPSLALQAVIQAEAAAAGRRLGARFARENGAIQLRDESGEVVKSIPVLDDQPKLENQMDVIVGLADQADLDHASVPYHRVYADLSDTKLLSKLFGGKIVLIGVKKEEDRWQVSASQHRYGAEIHATAISNLLQKVSIHPLGWGGRFAVIVLMSGIGLAAQTILNRWKGPNVALKKLPFVPAEVDFEVKIPVLVFVIGGTYLVGAFLTYKSLHVILNITYNLTALLLAYFWIGFVRKRSKPKTV